MADVTDPRFRKEERIDARTLRVTRKSSFTGKIHSLDLAISEADWARYRSGKLLIQDALPDITDPEREFLLTGTTQAEWQSAFADDEEEEDL